MQWSTWIEPNGFGTVVHYSLFIEMLLHIASYYVHNPMMPYSQHLCHIQPEFDMFKDFRIICICPQCEDYQEEDEEENKKGWEFFSDPDVSSRESSQGDSSSEGSMKSLPILQPCPLELFSTFPDSFFALNSTPWTSENGKLSVRHIRTTQ